MTRAIIYVRVSLVGARGDDLASPEIQEQACRDHCARNGYTVLRTVQDLNRSGRMLARRQVLACVEAIESGEAEVIVVWRWSRISRSRRDWAVLVDRVETLGGRIESALEPMDTTTATGRLGRGMLAEFAAFEAERIGETWRETHERRRSMGLPHAGYPKLGYTRTRTGYSVDPDTAPFVVESYRRYLAGEGFRLIAQWLDDQGIRHPRSGHPWSNMSVRWALDDGFAAGLVRTSAGYLPGAHEPIISAEMWEAYQRERRRRVHVPARTISASSPFAGLVRCHGCSGSMRLKVATSRKVRVSGSVYVQRTTLYVCNSRRCMSRASVTYGVVDDAVRAWLAPLAAEIEAAAHAQRLDRARRVSASSSRVRLLRQVTAAETQLVRLARELAAGSMERAIYDRARAAITAERDAAQRRLDEAATATQAPEIGPELARGLLAGWDQLDALGIREVLRGLGVQILVQRQDRPRARVTVTGGWERPTSSP